MEEYKVSVIVPVYNAEAYLEKCVASLIGQTYQNLEILLVNDGSKDNSKILCEKFAAEDHRIRVIHKENGGLVSAWKAGVRASSGEYLCFVDSDDWIDTVMIEEMAHFLTGDAKEIIACDYVIERDDGSRTEIYQQLPPGEYKGKALQDEVVPYLLGQEHRYVTISRCMKLIGRELILENQHYSDPSVVMGEDVTIMLPALIDCSRLVILDHKAYYHYLYVTQSMVHKYNAKLYENIRKLIGIMEQIIKDKFEGKEQEEREVQVRQEAVFLMLLVLKNEARGNPKGYRKNILKICRSKEVRELVNQTTVEIKQKANRLLYMVMKHPGHLSVSILRAAMIWYYR